MVHIESTAAPKPQVDARIRAALGGLRTRIRAYVSMYGIGAMVIWLGITFWAGFALDYLPVLLGASEMPRVARAVLLAIIGLGAAHFFYHSLIARLLVPLSDRSMAILLERQHADFRDSLVTAVELAQRNNENADALTRDMLAATGRHAVDELPAARPAGVFNYAPLLRGMALALILIASVGGGYVVNAVAMTKAARRLYLLDDERWERFARIAVVGIEVRRSSLDAVAPLLPDEPINWGTGVQSLAFDRGEAKVARGSNVTLKVEADAGGLVLPEQCYMSYETVDGDRGRVTMKRVGRVREGKQLYVCDAKPLAGILSTLEFDVLGYDHRLTGFQITVVDSPAVVEAKMDLRYPAYMVDEERSIRLPRQDAPVLSSGNPLPQGTHVTLHLITSKPLAEARVGLLDPEAADPANTRVSEQILSFNGDHSSLTFEIASLDASRTVEVSLRDTDGVTSERPYRTFLTSVPDEAPRWDLALRGIGNSVTPDVIVPLKGKVTDDYGVGSVWLETMIGDMEPVRFEVSLERGNELTRAIDFRQERMNDETFRLKPGDKLALTGRAVDLFNLSQSPNEGASERFVLEVVSPDELLVGLEARELALRRRFEVIIEEVTAMRDSLLRIRPGQATSATSAGPGDVEPGETKLSTEELARREADLRVLRAQRAFQQSKKSAQEVQGVAQAFDGICEELTNNRVDTDERKSRLKQQIADPLHLLVAEEFPKLDDLLLALEPLANDSERGPRAVEQSVARTNELLAQCDQILQKMLKLESYNEIVDLVRDLIKEQASLIDDTKKQQRRDLLED